MHISKAQKAEIQETEQSLNKIFAQNQQGTETWISQL